MMNTLKALKLIVTGHATVNNKRCVLDRTYSLIEMARANGMDKSLYWLPRFDRHFSDYRTAIQYIATH